MGDMGGSHCQNCQDLEKYMYWNNLPQTSFKFSKLMLGHFHHQMTIPEKFSNCFQGRLGKWCILKVPSGNTWKVRVTRTREDDKVMISFSEGWGDFVKDHGIKSFDMLFFSYTGDSSLDVSVFDPSGIELEGTHLAKNSKSPPSPTAGCSGHHTKAKLGDDHGHESESEPKESGPSRFKDPLYDGDDDHDDDSSEEDVCGRGAPVVQRKSKRKRLEKNRALQESSEDDYPSLIRRRPGRPASSQRAVAKEPQTVHISNRRPGPPAYSQSAVGKQPQTIDVSNRRLGPASSQRAVPKEPQTVHVSNRRSGRPAFSLRAVAKQPKTVHVSNRRPVTKEEIKRALYLASKFEIDNKHLFKGPTILITMLPTHVTRGFHLTIPKDWATEHMVAEDHDVGLQVHGSNGKWIVSCRWTPYQCHIRSRWPIFVRENNLEEHDVCVFELIRKGDLSQKMNPKLNVHIFRVVNKVKPLKEVRVNTC